MKFHKRFRTASLYIVSIFVAFSFPLTAFADDSVTTPPTTPTTTTATPDATTSQPVDVLTVAQPTDVPAIVDPITQPTDTTVTVVQPAQTTTIASQTGDAVVNANTTAGNATTGTAVASTTATTLVNSTTSLGSSETQGTFTKDITGNSTGDITLDPLIQNSLKGPSTASIQLSPGVTLTATNVSTSQALTVSATSGDATVSNNSSAGNATTGDAIAQANSINVINSVLASHGSFVGTINIYGNLDGDILISPGFLPSLVGSGSASSTPSSVNASSDIALGTTVALSAASGDATVSNNSKAGNATSGNATTNLVTLSVVGQQLNASDSLLVFVNVLGKWVGTIVSSPDGATTAFLATGVTEQSTTPGLIVSKTNTQVSNTISVSAQSGNALVTRNSIAGNATTGSAMASANILNLVQNTMDLSGWLGVLFINVYGNWTGSFGINTSSGDGPTPVDPVVIQVATGSTPPTVVASFPVRTVTRSAPALTAPSQELAAIDTNTDPPTAVLGATTTQTPTATSSIGAINLMPYVVIAGAILTAGIIFFLWRVFRRSVLLQ